MRRMPQDKPTFFLYFDSLSHSLPRLEELGAGRD